MNLVFTVQLHKGITLLGPLQDEQLVDDNVQLPHLKSHSTQIDPLS